MTEKEKMIEGEMYFSNDPELLELRERARDWMKNFSELPIRAYKQKELMIQEFFGHAGNTPFIEAPLRCDYGFNIYVGDDFFANFNCTLLDVCRIDIGDRCMLAPNVQLYTATHPIDPVQRASGLEYGKPIKIGNDVWIGGGAIINPGIVIGNNVVVASGSVVTKNVPDNVVVGGNPAAVIRSIELSE
ncbi:sugar O-acetyltransferase [Salipaludibacillus sp. CF4.18]|uniref:sugar O-acetyltransferase n=1 Tax=Salipaludibacillus sp. CF4.18 TaxID=3373081 RepID=UPI003EE66DA9